MRLEFRGYGSTNRINGSVASHQHSLYWKWK